MNNGSDASGEDPFADFWISNWERQCEVELENEPDLEGQVQSERDLSAQKLWYLFQNSAASVAQLFKGLFPYPCHHIRQVVMACLPLQIVASLRCSGCRFRMQQGL